MPNRPEGTAHRYLPLKPAVLHILVALADRESHGYGVIQAVHEHTLGGIRLSTGSLYRHLERLIDEGLVRESSRRRTDDDPRRGTYYRLTARGRAVLRAELVRLDGLVSMTRERGLMRSGTPS